MKKANIEERLCNSFVIDFVFLVLNYFCVDLLLFGCFTNALSITMLYCYIR